MPGHRERDPVPSGDAEVRRDVAGHDVERGVGPQLDRVRSGDRRDAPPSLTEPRDREPVVEAQEQLRVHGHDPARAANQSHDPSLRTARRHEVRDVDGPGLRLVLRLQHEGVLQIPASGRLDPTSLYTHRYPLEQLGTALNATKDRPDGFMKALVIT